MKPQITSLLAMTAMMAALAAPQATASDYFANAETGAAIESAEAMAYSAGPSADCCCCDPPWAHRTGLFGEYLSVRSRDSRVAFAEFTDGAVIPPEGVAPIQFGTLALVDQDYSPAFRVGGSFAIDCQSSLVASYTHFETETENAATVDFATTLIINSLVLHPGTFDANSPNNFLDAFAAYSIDYDLFDLDYRGVWLSTCNSAVNYVFGARYARLQQDFESAFGGLGTVSFAGTSLDFEGAGLRVGLDAERHACSGAMFYAKGLANFIAGEFSGRYVQFRDVDPDLVDVDFEEGRMISILEFELGLGWTSRSGRIHASAGYMVSAWYNMVKTDEFIAAVQQNDFVDLGDLMTFDGFVARAEVSY